jgi:hypothetical protein
MIDSNLFSNITNISYAFIFGGLIVVLMTVGTYNQNAVIGTISGYAAATCATLLLSCLTYLNIVTGNRKPSWSNIISVLVPFIVLFMIFGFSLALLSANFDKISQDKVGDYYRVFSYISVIFILIQVYMIHSATTLPVFRENGSINSLTSMKILLLAIVNIIVLVTTGVSLKYFSTDG